MSTLAPRLRRRLTSSALLRSGAARAVLAHLPGRPRAQSRRRQQWRPWAGAHARAGPRRLSRSPRGLSEAPPLQEQSKLRDGRGRTRR